MNGMAFCSHLLVLCTIAIMTAIARTMRCHTATFSISSTNLEHSGCGMNATPLLRKFLLATTYPKAVLKDQKKTLRQLKLLPSAVLTVCPE